MRATVVWAEEIREKPSKYSVPRGWPLGRD